jgi:enoyl-CoA hydratase/carnithine racemase
MMEHAMSDLVLVENADGIRTIRFNRPAKKNALTRAMYTAAAEALETGEDDNSVRVYIIGGTDGVFTAGNDLLDFMEHPPHVGGGEMPPVERFMQALLNVKKPVVAAVDGLAIGIGVTMLMHCDIVYASERATFKTPFVDLALPPEYGSSQVMPRMFGHVVAAELLLLGNVWNPDRAMQAGLITGVVNVEAIEETARIAARTLAAKAPGALRAAKALMRRPEDDLRERIKIEGTLFAELLQSDEFKEAATAFMERRKPDFAKFG